MCIHVCPQGCRRFPTSMARGIVGRATGNGAVVTAAAGISHGNVVVVHSGHSNITRARCRSAPGSPMWTFSAQGRARRRGHGSHQG